MEPRRAVEVLGTYDTSAGLTGGVSKNTTFMCTARLQRLRPTYITDVFDMAHRKLNVDAVTCLLSRNPKALLSQLHVSSNGRINFASALVMAT